MTRADGKLEAGRLAFYALQGLAHAAAIDDALGRFTAQFEQAGS